jgi:hypothetical protein
MRWKQDLVKDIRFGDGRDDMDFDWPGGAFPDLPFHKVTVRDIEGTDFSVNNRASLIEVINFKKDHEQLRCIVEIGVENNLQGLTSTSVFLKHKPDDCIYLGIDLRDLKQLDNPEKNIYTVATPSQNYPAIHHILDKLQVGKIDILFIDGWHSINQCLYDWEYTSRLADHGIVGFHDVAYHPGPYYFINNLNKNRWNVNTNAVKDPNDWGIGWAWPTQPTQVEKLPS